MARKTWVATIGTLALAGIAAGVVTGTTLAGGDSSPAQDKKAPATQESVSTGPITIIDDMDPTRCNMVHNINACDKDDWARLGMPVPEYEGGPLPPDTAVVHEPMPVPGYEGGRLPPETVVVTEPMPLPGGPGVSDMIVVPGMQERMVNLARYDLASRLGVDPDTIDLLYVEEVRWPNTALGNEQPDMFYAEVIVPGFKLVLAADGQKYDYHTDMEGRVELVS